MRFVAGPCSESPMPADETRRGGDDPKPECSGMEHCATSGTKCLSGLADMVGEAAANFIKLFEGAIADLHLTALLFAFESNFYC